MKCNNCEHNNPVGAIKCENCNVLLEGSMITKKENSNYLSDHEVMCKNCGTKNEVDALRCLECNTSLDGSMVIRNKSNSFDQVNQVQNVSPSRLKEEEISADTKIKINNIENGGCPKCGYVNRSQASICMQCGSTLNLAHLIEEIKVHQTEELLVQNEVKTVNEEKPVANNINDEKPAIEEVNIQPSKVEEEKELISKATINPWAAKKIGGFKLTPLQIDESSIASELFFAGDNVILKRDNLEKDNTTISSEKHASIDRVGDKWFISDNSSQKSTFIRIEKNVELKSGDVILIGNKLFSFKAE